MSDAPRNSVSKMLSQFFSRQSHQNNETVQSVEQSTDTSNKNEFIHLPTSSASDLAKPDFLVDSIEITESDLANIPTKSSENQANDDSQNALQAVLQDVMKHIPECKSLAYVDIERCALLAIHSVQTLPDEVQQLVAAATSDLFTAPNVIKVSNLYKQKKGMSEDKSNINEMIVHGEEDVYVFIRAKSNPNHVSVFDCRSTTPSGVVLINARQMMPQIEAIAESLF